MRGASRVLALVFAVFSGGCGGGLPLLHPAQTLPAGEVRAIGGVSANVAVGSVADDLRGAREIATRGDPGAGSVPYAKGALVAAVVAPGLAPFVAARVGVGHQFEGGIGYTGRSVRGDLRRSFEKKTENGNVALSVGVALSAPLYGRQSGSDLPNVDLKALHGYGGDIPVLVGFRSSGGLYQLWAGGRFGVEHDIVSSITSEPTDLPGPTRLEATRVWGGGVVGLATGFRHIHVAIELDAAYQSVTGTYAGASATVKGFSLSPASAFWWTF